MPVTVAQAALRYAKACTTMGPNNQGSGQLSAPKAWTPRRDPMQRMMASGAIMELKLTAPQRGCSMDEVVAYGRKVATSQAGNCLEQCAAAAVYLSGRQDAGPFNLVELAAPADHVFIAMDQPENPDHTFPDNFALWDANAVVIDPWAGICVKARHYPEIWRMKMEIMGAVGEELSSAGGWMKANNAYWTTAPTAHAKLAFCH